MISPVARLVMVTVAAVELRLSKSIAWPVADLIVPALSTEKLAVVVALLAPLLTPELI